MQPAAVISIIKERTLVYKDFSFIDGAQEIFCKLILTPFWRFEVQTTTSRKLSKSNKLDDSIPIKWQDEHSFQQPGIYANC